MGRQGQLDKTFGALADPTRRAIVARLSSEAGRRQGGYLSVGTIAEPFEMSLPAVLKHIRVLEDAGLIEREKRGRTVEVSLISAGMREAMDWLADVEAFWNIRLDALARVVEAPDEEMGRM